MTLCQVELLEKEDWRFHAIDALGTGLGMMATTEKLGERHLNFGLPSAPALYLSLARTANKNRAEIDVETCFVSHPKPQGIYPRGPSITF